MINLRTTIFLGIIIPSISSASVAAPTPISCSALGLPQAQFEIFEEIRHTAHYNKQVRPTTVNATSKDQQTKVEVDYYISSIDSINTEDGTFKISLILRQRWNDTRLAFKDSKYIQMHSDICEPSEISELMKPIAIPGGSSNVWIPDLFIPNQLEITRHSLKTLNSYIKIYPDGLVFSSDRISLTMSCPNLTKKNTSGTECHLQLESYAFKLEELELEWKKENPIYIQGNIFVPSGQGFDINKVSVTAGKCDTTTASGFTYSCLDSKFIFSNVPHYSLSI